MHARKIKENIIRDSDHKPEIKEETVNRVVILDFDEVTGENYTDESGNHTRHLSLTEFSLLAELAIIYGVPLYILTARVENLDNIWLIKQFIKDADGFVENRIGGFKEDSIYFSRKIKTGSYEIIKTPKVDIINEKIKKKYDYLNKNQIMFIDDRNDFLDPVTRKGYKTVKATDEKSHFIEAQTFVLQSSPLYRLILEGNEEPEINLIRQLYREIKNKNILRITNQNGDSILLFSVMKGYKNVVKYFLSKNLFTVKQLDCALTCMTYNGHHDLAMVLLLNNPAVKVTERNWFRPILTGDLPLHLLLRLNNEEKLTDNVKSLCNSMRDIVDIGILNREKESALSMAAKDIYHKDVTRLLLTEYSGKFSESDLGRTLLYLMTTRQFDLAKLLLELRPDTNQLAWMIEENGNTILHLSVLDEEPDIKLIELLSRPNQKQGENKDHYKHLGIKNKDGKTELKIAIERKNIPAIKCFLNISHKYDIEEKKIAIAFLLPHTNEPREVCLLINKLDDNCPSGLLYHAQARILTLAKTGNIASNDSDIMDFLNRPASCTSRLSSIFCCINLSKNYTEVKNKKPRDNFIGSIVEVKSGHGEMKKPGISL